jgi:hypothetical protein
MKSLFALVLSLLSSLALASPGAEALNPVGKTLALLGTSATDQGSIVVATDPAQVEELSLTLGLATPARHTIVAFTGDVARRAEALLAQHGIATAAVGSGDERVLVFVDDDACDVIKVLKHVFGDALDLTAHTLIVLKGGLEDVLGCLEQVLCGALDLGLDLAQLTAQVVCCTIDTLVDVARLVWEHAGCLVLKTAEGVILVAEFAAKSICDVLHHVGGDLWAVTKSAVCCAFHLVDGTIQLIGDALARLCDLLHCGCELGRARFHM